MLAFVLFEIAGLVWHEEQVLEEQLVEQICFLIQLNQLIVLVKLYKYDQELFKEDHVSRHRLVLNNKVTNFQTLMFFHFFNR